MTRNNNARNLDHSLDPQLIAANYFFDSSFPLSYLEHSRDFLKIFPIQENSFLFFLIRYNGNTKL